MGGVRNGKHKKMKPTEVDIQNFGTEVAILYTETKKQIWKLKRSLIWAESLSVVEQ